MSTLFPPAAVVEMHPLQGQLGQDVIRRAHQLTTFCETLIPTSWTSFVLLLLCCNSMDHNTDFQISIPWVAVLYIYKCKPYLCTEIYCYLYIYIRGLGVTFLR